MVAPPALGENRPAKPPLSFHASGCPAVVGNAPPEMAIPRSWLKPALAVQRSEFPPIHAIESAVGVTVVDRPVPSMSCQVVPSLFCRWYWSVLILLVTLAVETGTSCTERRVGENAGPIGPAPE